jgi:hypothetical protein
MNRVVVAPPVSARAAEVLPEETREPPTVTDAPVEASVRVGVTVIVAILSGTVIVYDVVLDAKTGASVPALSTNALSVLTVLSAVALLTVTVYVFMVSASSAVTTMTMAVFPTSRLCKLDSVPEATVAPATVIVALI